MNLRTLKLRQHFTTLLTILLLFLTIVSLFPANLPALLAARPMGDNNIHWDELYHNTPNAPYGNPATELVPNETFHFREEHADGSADIYFVCDWQDLSSANVVYRTAADGWQDHWVPMTWIKNISGNIHGYPAASGQYDLWKAVIPAQTAGAQVAYRIQANDGSVTVYLKSTGAVGNPARLGQWIWTTDNPSQANWTYTVSGGSSGHDNNIQWNNLYHNNPAAYNPDAETVLTQSYTFRKVNTDGSADLYLLGLNGDLTGATILWEASDNWGQQNIQPMTITGVITAAFHSQPATVGYEIWKATLPAKATGVQVYYRFQVTDGTAVAYLKNQSGTLQNPLGQWIWSADNSAQGNWSYTLGGSVTPTPSPTPYPTPTPQPPVTTTQRTAIVHLFEWKWTDIAQECENYLGPMGFAAVQVSPPQEHRVIPESGHPWWERYQPVSYQLVSRSGSEAEFTNMITRCAASGVKIYVDAVINHMSGMANNTSTTGSAGHNITCDQVNSGNCVANYPQVPYTRSDFHLDQCNHNIGSYDDAWEARNCELLGLDDLKTENNAIQDKLATYLNYLTYLGVAGFRIDAAKHMYPSDIVAVKGKLTGNPFIYQEVIQAPLTDGNDYLPAGSVTEFRYSNKIGSEFFNGSIAWLQGIENGKLPSASSIVFVDNHDNQRSSGILTHKNADLYKLANVFMLAYPYGTPSIMSSFYFSNNDQGPPSDGSGHTNTIYAGGRPVGCDAGGGWACEHRWLPIGNMVAFRNFTADHFYLTDWWTNGNDQIAFGRGDAGFVAINRENGSLNRTFQTSMAPGDYCDIIHGSLVNGACTGPVITVQAGGSIALSVAAMDAVAIHIGARPGQVVLPQVTLLSPATGATVSGAFTVAVTATHAVTISNVTFYVDNHVEGTVYAAPYRITLNAAAYTPGSHTLRAVATAADGLQGAAAGTFNIAVTPLVSITAPADGALVSGNFPVTATATHPNGIAGVVFLVDGTAVATDTTPSRKASIRSLKRAPAKTIVIDGLDTSNEWTDTELIATAPAHNSAQVAAPCPSGPYCNNGHTWSTHERQVDFTALYATWDTTYLYIGIQGVDVIDIEDPANANSGDALITWNMPLFVGFDTRSGGYGMQTTGDMWGKPAHFSGTNQLDYQVYFASNFWQGPVLRQYHDGTGWDSVDTSLRPGGAAGHSDAGAPILGPDGRNYRTLGHNTGRDSFWEIKVPLSNLGNPDLENSCIGVFVGHGDYSSIDSIPADPATLDTPGASASNSPLEWSDRDIFTVPFAKIGRGTQCNNTAPSTYGVTLNAASFNAGLHNLEARALSTDGIYGSAFSTFAVGNGPNLAASTKTVTPLVAFAGDTLTYTIVLSNTGNQSATVLLTDTLPTGVSVVTTSLPGGLNYTAGRLTWNNIVTAGDRVVLTFKATVNTGVANTILTNTALIQPSGGTVVTRQAGTQIRALGPDLSTSFKSATPATVQPAGTITYTLALSNTGTQNAAARITDTLPAGVAIVPGSLPPGMGGNNSRLVWSGPVTANTTVLLSFRVTVNAGISNTTLVNGAQIDDGNGNLYLVQAGTTVAAPGPCANATTGDGNVVTAEIYHSNLDAAYRNPVGTVSMSQPATLTLRTCHGDVQQVTLLVWKTGETLGAPGVTLTATAVANGAYDNWIFYVAPPTGGTVDQWYQFKLQDGSTLGYYHPNSGNTGPGVWYTGASQQNPSWSLPRTGDNPQPTDCTGAAAGDNAIRSAGLYHIDTDTAYRTPLGNLSMGQTATLRLRSCLNDVQQVQVWVWKTGAGATPSYIYTATVETSDAGYTYWKILVPAPDLQTDQWYQFKVTDGTAAGYYHPISGNTGGGAWSTTGPGSSWKLGTNPGPIPDVTDVPTWIQDAVIYQIFPDRFRDGNAANNPPSYIQNVKVYGPNTCQGYPHGRGSGPQCVIDGRGWNDGLLIPSYGIDFYGGDLDGIIQKINEGYFNNLGVNTLYLNPIFEASSNHGYDTNDYYHIRTYFGGDAKFDEFITAAHNHNLRVILDAVFNHTGMDSRYIDHDKVGNPLGACGSVDSPYRAWFTSGSQGSNFSCANGWGWKGWYGYETIPELVDDNADVRDFFFRGGSAQSPLSGTQRISVAEYWLRKGIDGWRFDVAQDISHNWFQEMRPYFKTSTGTHYGSREVLILGEVTGGCASGGLYESYTRGNELDSVMNYCFRDWVAGYASGNNPSYFDNSFNDFRNQYPTAIWHAMMNLISSHDSPRLYQMVGSDYGNLKLAVMLQMLIPGAPSVYYGDEIGLPGGSDPDNRRTYPWTDRGGTTPDPTMFTHYQKLIGIRNAHAALRGGDMKTLLVDNSNHLYSFLRWNSSEQIVVVLKNTAGDGTQAVIPVSAYFPNGTVLTDTLNNNATYVVNNGNLTLPVNGKWGAVLIGPAPLARINQAPTLPNGPSPAHGAVNIPANIKLQWYGGDPDNDPVTYTVAFGTTSTPPVVGTLPGLAEYTPLTLTAGNTYYWRITATDGLSSTVGPLWSFTVVAAQPVNQAPNAPSNPTPADGATAVPTNTVLGWQDSDPDGNPLTYTVAFGTSATPPVVATGVTATHYNPGALAPLTVYYWNITASDGLSSTVGATWVFTTGTTAAANRAPYIPNTPFPALGALDVTTTPTFTWSGGDPDGDRVTYTLAYGKAQPLQGPFTLTTTQYNPAALVAGQTYTWIVTATDGLSSTVGPLWTFTTAAYKVYLPVVMRKG